MKCAIFLAAVMAVAAVQAAPTPIDNIKLRFKISARDLPDKDPIGTIDPYTMVYYTDENTKEETELGRTSTLSDEENPEWGDVFEFDFVRAKHQRWHFKVYDHDNGREDDKAGHAYVDVADFVDKNGKLNVNLNKKGYLILNTVDPLPTPAPPAAAPVQTVPIVQPVQTVPVVQPGVVLVPTAHQAVQPVVTPAKVQQPVVTPAPVVAPVTNRIRFKLSASGLEDKDIYGTSDPYVKVYGKLGSEPERLIGNTAKLTDTENPTWPDIMTYEYDPSKQPKLHFLVLDDDENRRDDELGEAWLDVNEYVQKNQDSVSLGLKQGSLKPVTYLRFSSLSSLFHSHQV